VDPIPDRRRLGKLQILEATAATVLSAAIVASAGGVTWLVVQLPTRLQQIETAIDRIIGSQSRFENRFEGLEKTVQDHDRRIIKLEVRQ
jgi:hypothetical protein